MPWNYGAIPRVRTVLDLYAVKEEDIANHLMVRLGQEHRKQEERVFSSEGATGFYGKWRPLSDAYAIRKAKAMFRQGRRMKKSGAVTTGRTRGPISMKVLVWSGNMRDTFTTYGYPGYIQRYRAGLAQFGARHQIAAYHFHGGGRLPRRDMVTKAEAQLRAMRRVIVQWYRGERIPQIDKAKANLLRANAPERFEGTGR